MSPGEPFAQHPVGGEQLPGGELHLDGGDQAGVVLHPRSPESGDSGGGGVDLLHPAVHPATD